MRQGPSLLLAGSVWALRESFTLPAYHFSCTRIEQNSQYAANVIKIGIKKKQTDRYKMQI